MSSSSGMSSLRLRDDSASSSRLRDELDDAFTDSIRRRSAHSSWVHRQVVDGSSYGFVHGVSPALGLEARGRLDEVGLKLLTDGWRRRFSTSWAGNLAMRQQPPPSNHEHRVSTPE